MDLNQRKLARHALGLPNDRMRSYRNRYACTPGCDAYREWENMVAAGEATFVAQAGKVDMFYLTRAAALAVCDPGERLDAEDFDEPASAPATS